MKSTTLFRDRFNRHGLSVLALLPLAASLIGPAVIGLMHATSATAAMQPVQLRCEAAENPLGVKQQWHYSWSKLSICDFGGCDGRRFWNRTQS